MRQRITCTDHSCLRQRFFPMQCILTSSQHVIPQRRAVGNNNTVRHMTVSSIASTKRDKQNNARVSQHKISLPCIFMHYCFSTGLCLFQVTGITQLSNGKSQHFGSPSNITIEEQPASEPNTTQTNKNITDLLKGASQLYACQSPRAPSVTCFVTFSILYLLSAAFLFLHAEYCNTACYCCLAYQQPSTTSTQAWRNPSISQALPIPTAFNTFHRDCRLDLASWLPRQRDSRLPCLSAVGSAFPHHRLDGLLPYHLLPSSSSGPQGRGGYSSCRSS